MSIGNCNIDSQLWCLQETVMLTGTLWYLQGIVMVKDLQGTVMFAETSDIDREMLCLLGTFMSTENCDVHRELVCLQGPVMFRGTVMSTGTGMSTENCDVNREFLCLQGHVMFTGTVLSTRNFCRYISNLQPNTCWEYYYSLREILHNGCR